MITRQPATAPSAYLDALEPRSTGVRARAGAAAGASSQLHWGGGTPTYFTAEQLLERAARGASSTRSRSRPDAELGVEVDPRVTTPRAARRLRELGFNRLAWACRTSIPRVQEAINRDPAVEDDARRWSRHARALGFPSVNIDLIYGLPHQTPRRLLARTVDRVLEIRPERLAVYSYATCRG